MCGSPPGFLSLLLPSSALPSLYTYRVVQPIHPTSLLPGAIDLTYLYIIPLALLGPKFWWNDNLLVRTCMLSASADV